MSWGEDIDEELQNKKEFKVGFLLSFKSMSFAIDHIKDTVTEKDDKHPKDDLHTIWFGAMLMMLVFLAFTYNVLACATLPFIGFYTYVLIKLDGAYRYFQYNVVTYRLITILAICAEIAVTTFLRGLIV